jgi:hypothetical protein
MCTINLSLICHGFLVKLSGMPTYPYLYGDDLVDVLKKKHAAGTYKSLVPDQFFGYFCCAWPAA